MDVQLHHVALWTHNLERLKEFYIKYLNASCNKLYHNRQTGFKSYFLTFQGGAKIEIMQKEGIPENMNDTVGKQNLGLQEFRFYAVLGCRVMAIMSLRRSIVITTGLRLFIKLKFNPVKGMVCG